MKLAAQLAGLTVLLAVVSSVPVLAAPAQNGRVSVFGVVRDSAGVPQIGAQVQLLRPDLSVVASVYTNSQGRFIIASIFPGRYALKAMDDSFLPSLRENVHRARRPNDSQSHAEYPLRSDAVAARTAARRQCS